MFEIKIGLGLVDVKEIEEEYGIEFDENELEYFDEINALYAKRDEGCYFCDKSIDPNSDFFHKSTELCPMCQLKVANLLEFEKIAPLGKRYLPFVFDNKARKKF